MHLAAPREKNPVSRQKNCYISGITGNFFKILFFRSQGISRRSYGMKNRVGSKLYTERESKNRKTGKLSQESQFWTNFPEVSRKVGFQSPLTRLKITERSNRKHRRELKKNRKNLRKSEHVPCFFEPARGKIMLISFGKIFISR